MYSEEQPSCTPAVPIHVLLDRAIHVLLDRAIHDKSGRAHTGTVRHVRAVPIQYTDRPCPSKTGPRQAVPRQVQDVPVRPAPDGTVNMDAVDRGFCKPVKYIYN